MANQITLVIEADKSFPVDVKAYTVGLVNKARERTLESMIQRSKGLVGFMDDMIRKHLNVTATDELGRTFSGRGRASSKLMASIKHQFMGSRTVKSANNIYSKYATFDLDMNDYGFAIGSKSGFKFTPAVESLSKWIREKIGRGHNEFYVPIYSQTSSGKYSIVDKKKPQTERDIKAIAYSILFYRAAKKNYALTNWYNLTEKNKETLKGRLISQANLDWIKAINELNKK